MKKYNEFSLIEKIKQDFSFKKNNVLGIGDDCALLKDENILITTDTLVEDKHFLFEKTDFFLLGRKSLSVNLSDIAAMGGEPLYFLLTLGIPAYMEDHFIENYLSGLKECAEEYETLLIGGDCVASDNFFISITLLGKVYKKVLLRSGAKVGDNIYLTGNIGDSFFGLSVLLGDESLEFKDVSYFINKHLNPTPRINLMKKINSSYNVNSAIDISDGMLGDLIHIAEESKCGFEIFLENVPISIERIGDFFYEKELEYILKAISGGEDYEILFTSPDDISEKQVTKIGKITEKGYSIFYKNEKIDILDIKHKSFIHF